MGFWGTFVLARSATLLANVEAVRGFGYQHEHLYELGDGWQLLETRAPLSLGLPQASERFVAATATSVLAMRVFNSDCLRAHARTADGWSTSFHVPGPADECPHRHAEPEAPRAAGAVAADLARWAGAGGLTPSAERLEALVDQTAHRRWSAEGADTAPFAMLSALGLGKADQPYPATIDLDEPVYCAIIGWHGLARKALNNAALRVDGLRDGERVSPQEPWEAAALELEAELWAARFRAEADTAALRQRAEQLCAQYEAMGHRRPPPWRGV
ncbi:hypothetical protein [Dactylosporangium sp. CA-139066]|uniref:hypothetical protein n=1 Tax=Dactylosporangium sp. CA-139066 TaxID=3239930 RepID=UPI003D923995